MLSHEQNALLTLTGPTTPMGNLLRRYWIPILFSEQLPGPDCAPVRVKVLGEKLVAFRNSEGKTGLVDERCPHRNASMFFGRNEESGLRCVYHGWKFDLEGRCVDMPSEPPESNFKNKVRLTAYPCVERGGLVWAYMGPAAHRPAFPDLEWTAVPPSHRFVTRHIQECNWFQALEGGYDISHLHHLHRGAANLKTHSTKFEFMRSDFGFIAGNGSQVPEGTRWLASVMLMPFHKLIGRHAGPDAPIGAHIWVPIDDGNCMIYSIEYHPDRPLGEAEMANSKNWNYIHAELIPGTDRAVRNRDNDYLIDRELQKSGASFTGLKGFGIQDCGIQETMGPIADRTRERLGKSDSIIIKLREGMLKLLDDFAAGEPLPGMDAASYRVRSAVFTARDGEAFGELAPGKVLVDAKRKAEETPA